MQEKAFVWKDSLVENSLEKQPRFFNKIRGKRGSLRRSKALERKTLPIERLHGIKCEAEYFELLFTIPPKQCDFHSGLAKS